MILGLLSDTHGDADIAGRAVALLRERGAEFLIHCGDVGGEGVLDTLAGIPAAFVFGNNDLDRRALDRYACDLGIDCLGDGDGLTLDGVEIGVTHGDDRRQVDRMLAADSPYRYVFTGHSHVPHDRRVNGRRWVNPGALFRARVKTVATLDLRTDELAILEVGAS